MSLRLPNAFELSQAFLQGRFTPMDGNDQAAFAGASRHSLVWSSDDHYVLYDPTCPRELQTRIDTQAYYFEPKSLTWIKFWTTYDATRG